MFRCMSLDFTDDKSPLVQVMAWCRQATSHYLSQWWPRFMLPYGVSRPQWVNRIPFMFLFLCGLTYSTCMHCDNVAFECIDTCIFFYGKRYNIWNVFYMCWIQQHHCVRWHGLITFYILFHFFFFLVFFFFSFPHTANRVFCRDWINAMSADALEII